MKKNNQISLRIGIYSIAALAFALTPYVTASADIATGDSPGQQAAFAALGGGGNSICSQQTGSGPTPTTFACAIQTAQQLGGALPTQQSSPQSAIQAESIAITSPYQFIRNVNQQAQKLRDCEASERQQDTAKKRRPECDSNWKSGGGSSTDAYSFIGPFGLSLSGGGGFGDRETTSAQTGFKIDTRQANLIIDYSFTRELIGGFAFNYVSADRNLALASGKLNSDSYRFAPFLSYTPTPNSYITLLGGYARVDFDSTRSVSPFVGHTLTDAKANYGANEYFASLGAGYTHRFGAWSLRGYGRGDYNHLNIGGFQENGGVDLNDPNLISYTNKVNGQSILSATSTLGAELSYAFSTTTLAAVVIPKLHAEWVHEYKNNSRQSQTTFNAAGGILATPLSSVQSIAVSGPERNWANLGFGVQMLFPHAIVGYLNYDTLFIQNGSNQTVTGGIRVNF